MQKTILITGSTDGRGLETARELYSQGHQILLHGRNPSKLQAAEKALQERSGHEKYESFLADLTCMVEVKALGESVSREPRHLDVLINNAGIFRTRDTFTSDGLDIRFAVNTIAPCLLTERLTPLLGPGSRVINLSSAVQAPVDPDALAGHTTLPDQFDAYAQSKLALTMWSRTVALAQKNNGPAIIAVNPGSLLATRMVKEGFGMAGSDVRIGSDILVRASLAEEFAEASGLYFDNDKGRFASPHPDALDPQKCRNIVRGIEVPLSSITEQ